MGFLTKVLEALGIATGEGYVIRRTIDEPADSTPLTTQNRKAAPCQTSAKTATTATQPTLIKEPDDLGKPGLPRPEDVPWLSNPQQVDVATQILQRETHEFYYWRSYYVERKPIEKILSRQEQVRYDHFWHVLRECWKVLRHPFWSSYLAGHFPDPQVVKDDSELVKEICVMDVKELKRRQITSLIKDGVYNLDTLRNSLLNARWQPEDINDRDKWFFRKVLAQYGLVVPLPDEPEPIPFAELYIGAVLALK